MSQKKSRNSEKSNKDTKLNQPIKEIITYKFMAQKYSFSNFESDLQNSGLATFNLEDIASMFANEPFFLNE